MSIVTTKSKMHISKKKKNQFLDFHPVRHQTTLVLLMPHLSDVISCHTHPRAKPSVAQQFILVLNVDAVIPTVFKGGVHVLC